MKIAQVAPQHESIPPKLYGGTERVVSYVTEELVRQNHDVTLFASGDSITSAKLVSVIDNSLRLSKAENPMAYDVLLLEEVSKRSSDFDIIHFHTDFFHFPLSRRMKVPQITTLHGRLDIPVLQDIYRIFDDMPVVSISNSQRAPLLSANWVGTVYNGIPEKNYTYQPTAGNYLAFLGRISPEKGVELAIKISLRSGMPLKIAAKVDAVDQDYYIDKIKPLLRHPLIEYIGEINEVEKNAFLGNAYAMLFPIQWPEPFGLVMIEAMACGTPTIAFPRGSVYEVMQQGKTGFIVDSVEQAVNSVEQIETIKRQDCNKVFHERFSDRIMTRDYLEVYHSVMADSFQYRQAQ
jgi:glycosyltransferase involved in cell wall biosynthesis